MNFVKKEVGDKLYFIGSNCYNIKDIKEVIVNYIDYVYVVSKEDVLKFNLTSDTVWFNKDNGKESCTGYSNSTSDRTGFGFKELNFHELDNPQHVNSFYWIVEELGGNVIEGHGFPFYKEGEHTLFETLEEAVIGVKFRLEEEFEFLLYRIDNFNYTNKKELIDIIYDFYYFTEPNISIREMSRRLGIPKTTIHNWFYTDIKNIKLSNEKVNELLGYIKNLLKKRGFSNEQIQEESL
jgi:hypothetical protein